MVQKFDSTAHERGTTATIPPQYYVPKKSEEYWIDVVDEGVGKSGLPNKTRRQGILNLLEDRMRKDPLMRLGFQELVGQEQDDPSASGIVSLIKMMRLGKKRGLRGVMLSALRGANPNKTYQDVRRQIEQRIAEGKAPSHFDSSLPPDAFRDRPVAAYTLSGFPGDSRRWPWRGLAAGDSPAPPGYDPAYRRGIVTLAHEIRHAGFRALGRTPTGTEAEMRAVDEMLSSPGKDEPLQRAYDAAYRKHDPVSRRFMSRATVEREKEGMRLYPKPYDHPIQSAAEKMLRYSYAGRELYAPLEMQPR
jgi:hypothetical protein